VHYKKFIAAMGLEQPREASADRKEVESDGGDEESDEEEKLPSALKNTNIRNSKSPRRMERRLSFHGKETKTKDGGSKPRRLSKGANEGEQRGGGKGGRDPSRERGRVRNRP
jgi:hypothetical protein